MSFLATTKSRNALMLLLGLIALGTAGKSQGAESASAQRMKAEIQRKAAEHKRKLEEQKREIMHSQSKHRQKVMQGIAGAQNGTIPKPQKPAIHAANAPPPAECLRSFVHTARSSSSMEPLLRFLPDGQARSLREGQANYDPKQAASNRASLKKLNPNLNEESLTHLASSPFASSLKFHKGLASEIHDVLSVKVEGDEAKLVVSTKSEAIINGGHWPYSKATVEMIAEGNYWKLSRYQPSDVYYQEMPTKP